MLKLSSIIPTQLSVRHHAQVHGMTDFVRGDGFFTREELDRFAYRKKCNPGPVMQINVFEDSKMFLLDGHHRAIGIYEAGRDYLRSDEYKLLKYTYKEFEDIVFLWPNGNWMGWVTPFNPKDRVRLPEIGKFKSKVKFTFDKYGSDAAVKFIEENIDEYSCVRDKLLMPLDNIEHLRNLWAHEIQQLTEVPA